jgi:cytochrome c peroxidase
LLAVPEYVQLFSAAYPGRAASTFAFTDAARALAAFQMEAFTKTGSPFDRYLNRDDAALTAQQKRGATLFFGKASCSNCHNGPMLGAQSFANVGVPQVGPGVNRELPLDLGRGEIENHEFYRFAFRVAPLRNVELTAPYMHNGAYPTLDAVLRHYNDVPLALRTYDPSQLPLALRSLHHGDEATVQQILNGVDPRLRVGLDLTDAEQNDLVAFLKSLTDPAARNLGSLLPARVPSGLPVQ